MSNHRIKMRVNGREVYTLRDILPHKPGLKVLFVAKTPAPISVKVGHYFQGRHGTSFWNKLKEFGLLIAPSEGYGDDHLLKNGYGITDIVKVPRGYGNDPSEVEYRDGTPRILELIKLHEPMVVVFVYKRVLDNILKIQFAKNMKSDYGFNLDLTPLFGTKVFVFPMPGTPCTSEMARQSMLQLATTLGN